MDTVKAIKENFAEIAKTLGIAIKVVLEEGDSVTLSASGDSAKLSMLTKGLDAGGFICDNGRIIPVPEVIQSVMICCLPTSQGYLAIG